VNSTKEQDLQKAIAEIKKKFGEKSIRQGTPEPLSTGFPTLDNLIGGGVMRGNLTELIGKPTSGMMTLAFNLMAAAQKMGDGAIIIDLPATFDPSGALFCGVDVAEIFLIRYAFEKSLSALYDIITKKFAGVVVFNTFPRLSQKRQLAFAQTLNRLTPTLPLTQCALVVLSLAHQGRSLISQYADLRLQTAFRQPILANGEIEAYQTMVTVLKQKNGNEGKHVALQITLDPKFSEWEA
jgi:RecA/RadA recombinase